MRKITEPYTQDELREMRQDIRDGYRFGGGVGSRTDSQGNTVYFRSTGGSTMRALRRRYVHPDVARAEYAKTAPAEAPKRGPDVFDFKLNRIEPKKP